MGILIMLYYNHHLCTLNNQVFLDYIYIHTVHIYTVHGDETYPPTLSDLMKLQNCVCFFFQLGSGDLGPNNLS